MDFPILLQSTIFGESESVSFQPYKGYRFQLPAGMSYCTACKMLKPISEFNKESKNVHGLKTSCRDCSHSYYAENQREWNSSYMRERNLRVKFSLTIEDYESLLRSQGNCCAVCGQPETKVIQGVVAQLSVDHNHETGEIRGLLCSACNLGLGYFRDNIEALAGAIDYLMRTHR